MFPISYKTVGNRVEFFYEQSEWDMWIAMGKRYGNIGSTLKFLESGGVTTHFCFGTYEHPMRDMYVLSTVHNPLFDGEFIADPEYYLKPLAEARYEAWLNEWIGSMKVVFLDFSDDKLITDIPKPKFKL